MSRSTTLRLLLLQSVLLIVLFWALTYVGRDEFNLLTGRDEEEIPTASRVQSGEGLPEIKLARTAQAAAGIEVEAPKAHRQCQQIQIPVTVIDPLALVDLRARLQSARQELEAARAAAAGSAAEEARTAALFRDDRNASERALQAAQAQARGDAARVLAAQAALDAARASATASWGATIADWLDARQSGELDRLFSGQGVLLRAAIRGEDRIKGKPGPLLLSQPGSDRTSTAALVSAAPQADPQLSGATYFYRADASVGLRPGMRAVALLPGRGDEREGVLIPGSALVWQAGKPWIYLREGEDVFQRKGIAANEPIGDTWFVTGIEDDAQVVVRGAQMLLSEELKSQIKNENDD